MATIKTTMVKTIDIANFMGTSWDKYLERS